MASDWYCMVQGAATGPHSADELRGRAERGDLPPDAQVRRGTDGRWARADSVKGLTFKPKEVQSTYKITGPDRHSGRLREVSVVAASQDEAERMAARAGVLTGTAHDAAAAVGSAGRPAATGHTRYPALAVLDTGYRVLAAVCGLAAVGGVVVGLQAAERTGVTGYAIAAGAAVWGLLTVISLVAVAEGIRLMTDIEFTLRQIRDRLGGPG